MARVSVPRGVDVSETAKEEAITSDQNAPREFILPKRTIEMTSFMTMGLYVWRSVYGNAMSLRRG